jgi:hypothetical protein
MKLHIITVAYERPIALRLLIDSFILQTNPNWEMDIVHDGPASKQVWNTIDLYKNDKRVRFWESEKRYHTQENPTFGHPNRSAMLQKIKGQKDDFVLITNDDNYYTPKFIEYCFDTITPEIGFVYCDTVHSHSNYAINYSRIREGCIDMGAFMVRFDIAKETGFNHTHFSADGKYAEECNYKAVMEKGLHSVKIDKCLFIHN